MSGEHEPPPPPYSELSRAPAPRTLGQSSRKHLKESRRRDAYYGSVSTTTTASVSYSTEAYHSHQPRVSGRPMVYIFLALVALFIVTVVILLLPQGVMLAGPDRQMCVENALRRKQRLGHGVNFPNATGDMSDYLEPAADVVEDNQTEDMLPISTQSDEGDSEPGSSPINETDRYEASGIHWAEPQPFDSCASYGKREYAARLWGIPLFHSWEEACWSNSITIHEQEFKKPITCENRGQHGIYGHWIVEGEAVCKPYWDLLREEGCMGAGSGKRRFHARLDGLRQQDRPDIMCGTTPIIIYGVEYSAPDACSYWGVWRTPGIYGVWDIDDENCC